MLSFFKDQVTRILRYQFSNFLINQPAAASSISLCSTCPEPVEGCPMLYAVLNLKSYLSPLPRPLLPPGSP